MCHLIASCFPKYDSGDIVLVYRIANGILQPIWHVGANGLLDNRAEW